MKRVTLVYLRRGDQVLLAMKKRGFGAGKWNAPGGKAEPDESTEAAAIRECQEEVGITPHNLRLLGDIVFYMPHEPNFTGHHMFAYATDAWEGEPVETEEMRPQWFTLSTIPYDAMWPADRRWLPDALTKEDGYIQGKIVQGPHNTILEYDVRHL